MDESIQKIEDFKSVFMGGRVQSNFLADLKTNLNKIKIP